MTVIPNFILKKLYQAGSLTALPEGIGFNIINNLGPGQISQLNSITINEQVFLSDRILLKMDDKLIEGRSITENNPATFFLNQVITCIIQGLTLPPGDYSIKLDLISREAGKVVLTVKDQLQA
ncbi:MAG: hypothetical protein AAGI66_05725 [Cyanobacteria bacterium P01_H01_bin.74]